MTHIYLDHNSTSIIDPQAVREVAETLAAGFANPASQHEPGQRARRAVESFRRQLLTGLGGVTRDRLIVTSGGTEANNLAIFGLCGPAGSNVVLSAIEHPSVLETARTLQERGIEVRRLPARSDGRVAVDQLDDLIDDRTTLVCLMLANNETGVLQPVKEAAEICRSRGVCIHSDAVQAVARIDVHFQQLGIDTMSLAAHKFHGPRGVGGLLVRGDVELRPLLLGGLQQTGARPGTEDVSLLAGMCGAFQRWHDQRADRQATLVRWREDFESTLLREISDAVIIGGGTPRLPQTICVSFPGVNRQALFMLADLNQVAISTGSACASGSSSPAPSLVSMKLEPALIDGAVRISFGIFNREDELRMGCQKIVQFVRKLRQKATTHSVP